MPRPVYSVDNPNTVLQQVEELKKLVKGQGYRVVVNQELDDPNVLEDYIVGLYVPNGVQKITIRYELHGAGWTELTFRIGFVVDDTEAVYYGYWPGDKLFKLSVRYADNKGYISAFEQVGN